jgi:ATP-binding cassette subfamily B protein
MKVARARRRTLGMLLTTGWRAAPGPMALCLPIAVITGVASGFGSPYGIKLFAEAAIDRNPHTVVWAILVLISAMIGIHVGAWLTGATIGQRLGGRVGLHLNTRIAELTATTPGIEHFERAEYLRELDLLSGKAPLIGQSYRDLLSVLTAVVRIASSVVLLVAVSPVLALLMLSAAVPFGVTRWPRTGAYWAGSSSSGRPPGRPGSFGSSGSRRPSPIATARSRRRSPAGCGGPTSPRVRSPLRAGSSMP